MLNENNWKPIEKNLYKSVDPFITWQRKTFLIKTWNVADVL